MKSILMANVGNRDVKYDDQDIKPPRLYGKDYLERFDAVAEHLSFPIISKGLDCVFQELGNRPLDHLILFYTDQNPKEVKEPHFQADTIYFAELIMKMINLHLKDKIRSVILEKIPSNPNDYDITYEYFSDELRKIENEKKPDRVFLSPAGGIPACNMNLLLQGSRIFTRRAVTLLIPENPDKTAKLQKLGELINRENNRQIIHRLLDEYDFGGVAELLANETDSVSKSLFALARAVQYRLYFDFKTAADYINQIEPGILKMPAPETYLFKTVTEVFESFKASMDALMVTANPIQGGQNVPTEKSAWLQLQADLNSEVLLNAKIKWLSKQYVDFLGRIFRLQEGILRSVFERETGYSTDTKQFPTDFRNYLERDPDFVVYINEHPVNGTTPVSPDLNRYTLLLFLEYKANTKGKEYRQVLKQCNKLDHLAALRNKCALAHGNAAVNDQIIAQKYGSDVWKNLSGLVRAFNLKDHLPQIVCIRNIIRENF